MLTGRVFWNKYMEGGEKLLWCGRPAAFLGHWGVPIWIFLPPAVIFTLAMIDNDYYTVHEAVYKCAAVWGVMTGLWAVFSIPLMAMGGFRHRYALTNRRLLEYKKGMMVVDMPLDRLMSVRLTDQMHDPSPLDDMGPQETHNYLAMTLYEANRLLAERMGKDPESLPKPELLSTDDDTAEERPKGYFNIVRTEFFSGRVVFLKCSRYKRLYRILDNMEKYEVLYEDNCDR